MKLWDMIINIFTAGKRSLGQGNIFTNVCHYVHRGSLHPVGLHPHGSASRGKFGGICIQRGWADPTEHYGIWLTSGWYASYWNGFLLPPAMKLRKGNIFTSMCQEFCPQWGMHGRGGHAWQGGMYEGVHGGMHGRVCVAGGTCMPGVW